jgi:choline dehydrogenase-like flavoprotein
VGAFFSNHVEGWAGYIQPSDRMITASLYRAAPHDSGTTRPFLAVSQELQQRERLLDCWIQPTPGLGMKSLRTGIARESIPLRINALRSPITNADVARFAAEVDHGKPLPLGRRGVPRPIPVRVIAETAPNPDSRVRLGEQVDALGQRRVVLDWRITEQDSRSTLRTLRILAREVGAAGIGRLRILYPSAGFPSIRTVASHHHMGTTRMHVDPSQGVVDPNCRMHGVDNLHVAGSSVFPTYGTANPTYTILALAFRLSERLKEELQS